MPKIKIISIAQTFRCPYRAERRFRLPESHGKEVDFIDFLCIHPATTINHSLLQVCGDKFPLNCPLKDGNDETNYQ